MAPSEGVNEVNLARFSVELASGTVLHWNLTPSQVQCANNSIEIQACHKAC